MYFKGKYFFLSNMTLFPYPIEVDGLTINTSENYYQAMKTEDLAIRKMVSELHPYKSKAYFKYTQPSIYHRQHKLDIMRKIIDIKFNIPIFKYLLLSTGDEELIEDNDWGDIYWGMCKGKGSNHLGKILMDKRKELQGYATVNKRIKIGNLYSDILMKQYDYIGFTSNSVLNKNNELIMGKGTASIIKDKFPNIPQELGSKIMLLNNKNEYNLLFINQISEYPIIFALQTKINWKDTSDINLVIRSIDALSLHAYNNPDKRYAIPIPGIGEGGLSIDIVLQIIDSLPDNVDIYCLPINQIYTGIGSRSVPDLYKERIYSIAKLLDEIGYTLRSGGADGSDTYFEEISTSKEIYLPWKDFNNNTSLLHKIPEAAKQLASFHHTIYNELKDSVKSLMNRNVLQVIGQTLNIPSDFVVCYTEDGCNQAIHRTSKTGGTGLAISLADTIGIKIYNVKNDSDYEELLSLIKSLQHNKGMPDA